LNSQNHEEVRKRRAKASPSRLNLHQKMVLVAGVLTLFLAIGISPQLAPILAAGVVGGMLVLFLIFKTRKSKRDAETKDAPQEALPAQDEAVEPHLIPLVAGGKMIDDYPPDSIYEQINPEGLQESMLLEPEEAIPPPQPFPVEKEELGPIQEFSKDGVLAQIQERLAMVEGRVSRLEDQVMDLEEKAASYQEGELGSEPQIDLQTILSHLYEKEGKVA
jgi:hypothetical protein